MPCHKYLTVKSDRGGLPRIAHAPITSGHQEARKYLWAAHGELVEPRAARQPFGQAQDERADYFRGNDFGQILCEKVLSRLCSKALQSSTVGPDYGREPTPGDITNSAL